MKKILVVEDDKNTALALVARLQANGYGIVTTWNGRDAVTFAHEEQPDLILLDISIPAGNGFSVAEKLLRSEKTCNIPFMFLTASKQAALRDWAFNLGARAFLEKPYESAELLAAVEKALSNGQD